ncbi:MAG: bifunctional hydroxymethylpyrimidine kinase/phosphomethylpyrimidine kinase [Myxococcota bacterium]
MSTPMSFLDQLIGHAPRPAAQEIPTALTIAGSDSGGGAGIQADLKTFAAHTIHGVSVVTLITAQNTQGVTAVHMLPEELVRMQLDAVVADFGPRAAKTGALGSEAMIRHVVELLRQRPIERLVVDPVMVSKHGDPLLPEPAQRALRDYLLEHALVVTPNQYEAEALTGHSVGDLASMKEAAKRIFDFGPTYVLIKGSQLDRVVRDLVYDGSGFVEFGADRIDTKRLHGSGCTYSAAITAGLAKDQELLESVERARDFIHRAIELAPPLGGGISPVNPMHAMWGWSAP